MDLVSEILAGADDGVRDNFHLEFTSHTGASV